MGTHHIRRTIEALARPGRAGPTAAVLVVAALLVAACGSGDAEDEVGATGPDACPLVALASVPGPIEVTVWHPFVSETAAAFQAVVDDYNASQDQVRVVAEAKGGSYEAVQDAYAAGAEAGELPAVVNVEEGQLQAMADSGTVVPASACIAAGGRQPDWLPAAEGYYTIDGTTWPAAFNLSMPVLYLNRGHFTEAGLDSYEPPETLDELRAAAEAIDAAGIAGLDAPFVLPLQAWFVENWLTGAGQDLVDEGNGRQGPPTAATLESDAALELLTWIKGMYDDGLLLPIADEPGQIDQYLAVGQQRGSMLIETSTAATAVEAFLTGSLSDDQLSDDDRVRLDALEEGELDLDVGAARFPGLSAPGRGEVGGGAYYVTNTSEPEVIAAAWDFMEHLNTLETQTVMNLEGSYLPSLAGAGQEPALAEVWAQTLSGDWLATAYFQLLGGVDPDRPGPVMGPYAEFREIVSAHLSSMLADDREPSEVLASMQEQVTAALEADAEG